MGAYQGHIGWLAAALAVSGLAITPAIARVFSDQAKGVSLSDLGEIGSFTPALADPDLVASFQFNALKGKKKFRFTPAAGRMDGQRSVTIAVRQAATANAVNVRKNATDATPGEASVLSRITPASYNLGAAKGWKSFALPVRNLGNNLPDLAQIGTGKGLEKQDKKTKPSRFNTRLSLDRKQLTGANARAVDESANAYSIDVGGSYSLTRNLDVTAGVRINNDRDRLDPLTDDRRDSQAVYVGTQFRF